MKIFMSAQPETHTIIVGGLVTLLVDTAVKNRIIEDFCTERSEFFRFPPNQATWKLRPWPG